MSTPPILMLPLSMSWNLGISSHKVVLPEPEGPIIAVKEFSLIVADTLCNTSLFPYEKLTDSSEISLFPIGKGLSLHFICSDASTSPIAFSPLSKSPIIDSTDPAWLSEIYTTKLNTSSIIVFTRDIFPSLCCQRVHAIIIISKIAMTNLLRNCDGIVLFVRLIFASSLPLIASLSSSFPSFTLKVFVTLIPWRKVKVAAASLLCAFCKNGAFFSDTLIWRSTVRRYTAIPIPVITPTCHS